MPCPHQMKLGSISSIFYAPDFVSDSDLREILFRLYASEAHADDGRTTSPPWVTLRSRRLQCWGGTPGDDFRPEPLPQWMETLCGILVERGAFPPEQRPNHILVNGKHPKDFLQTHVTPNPTLFAEGVRFGSTRVMLGPWKCLPQRGDSLEDGVLDTLVQPNSRCFSLGS